MKTITLLILLSATSVAAQDITIERGLRREPSLNAAVITVVTAAALDYTTTLRGLQAGGTEKNPLLSRWQSQPVKMVAIGLAADAGAALLIQHTLGKQHPRLAAGVLYGLSAARVAFAIHNERVR